MARIHARVKGKSRSHRPLKAEVPKWVDKKPNEVETLVVKFGKQGMSSALIGLTLRDSYGIPSIKTLTGKSITQILKENKLTGEIPEDLRNLIIRSITIRKHLEINKKDNVSTRGLRLTESKILRLQLYYKKNNQLPEGWTYNPKRAQLLIK